MHHYYFILLLCFFFKYTASTEIYTLSLHDALPISTPSWPTRSRGSGATPTRCTRSSTSGSTSGCTARSTCRARRREDRKSTRLNSSHSSISYAVFCLKKKKKKDHKLVRTNTVKHAC